MNHEARINDALRQLGEEYRLGMIQAEEYRARRRLLFEAWNELEVTTSPGSLRKAGFGTIPPGQKRAIAGASPFAQPQVLLAAAAVVVGIVVSGWFIFAPGKGGDAPDVALPPPVQLSEAVVGARKAAEDFLAVNAWETAPIEALMALWRQLSPEDRAQAREQPAVRTLRFKLDQNIQAESQLVAPDASPEDRQRLDLLTRFAQELDA